LVEGMDYIVFGTPQGWMGVLGSPAGLIRCTLPQYSSDVALQNLGDDIKKANRTAEPFKDLIARFQAYFSGDKVDFPDKLDLSQATEFQRSVWETTRAIPYGATQTYHWIASRINKPRAARAVGQALGQNPLPIIVPCHRVLAANGGLGGFTGGLDMKRLLLKIEGIDTF